MKKILLLIITLVPLVLIAQTPVPPGPISGTWDLAGLPYIVNGEVYIAENSTLEIDAGVEVHINGWYKFIVNGSLMAVGTEADNIIFTARDTNNRWHGIRFIETSKTSILDYCIVEYGLTDMGSTNFPDNSGGGILCYSSPNASITISNTYIQHNRVWRGGGVECYDSSPEIVNSTLTYNYAEGDGGAVALNNQASPVFIGNSIIHNSAVKHGGAMDIFNAGSFVAERNVVAHNSAKWGGGVAFYQSDGLFTNNTIVYNVASSDGGGLWLYFACCPDFTNDILYFNEVNGAPNQACFGNASTIPSFNHCDVQDSTAGFSGPGGPIFSGTYENCIDSNPLFADAANDDFTLTWNNYPEPDTTMSPCIDKGFSWPPDPDGTCCDIGAFCFYQQLDVPEALEATSISNNSFVAVWTSAFGALGYYLDVALDDGFLNMVYENIEIVGDTTYLVDGLDSGTQYFYRVNSYNTALTSNHSNTKMVTTLSVSVDEFDIDEIKLYTSHNMLYINMNIKTTILGEIWIYNIAGQLLTHQ